MSDLTKVLAENQKEMLKLIAPLNKKQPVRLNDQDSDSEPENISVARTSTPVKTTNTTNSKTTPNRSRNLVTGVFNDSTNQPTKKGRNNNVRLANNQKNVPQLPESCSRLNRKLSHPPTCSQCRKLLRLCYLSSAVSQKNSNSFGKIPKQHQNVPSPH